MSKTGRHINTDFNFLLVFDFSIESYKALDYLIKLAKVIGGNIELYSITEPKEVVKSENPIVALRAIAENNRWKKKKLQSITEIIQSEGISGGYSISTGLLKEELSSKLNTVISSIPVIAHSKSRMIKRATKHLTKRYSGSLLIINPNLKLDNSITSQIANSQTIPINGKVIKFRPKHIDNKINIELFKEALNARNIELNCIKRKRIKTNLIKRFFNYKTSFQGIIETSKTPLLITPSNNEL